MTRTRETRPASRLLGQWPLAGSSIPPLRCSLILCAVCALAFWLTPQDDAAAAEQGWRGSIVMNGTYDNSTEGFIQTGRNRTAWYLTGDVSDSGPSSTSRIWRQSARWSAGYRTVVQQLGGCFRQVVEGEGSGDGEPPPGLVEIRIEQPHGDPNPHLLISAGADGTPEGQARIRYPGTFSQTYEDCSQDPDSPTTLDAMCANIGDQYPETAPDGTDSLVLEGTRSVPDQVSLCDSAFNQGTVTWSLSRDEDPPECSDGVDNDEDGKTDFSGGIPEFTDPGCESSSDDDEEDKRLDAVDDTFTVDPATPGHVVLDVLPNDTVPPGGSLVSIEGVQRGIALPGGGDSVAYSPPKSYEPDDQFVYTITDGKGHTDSATVTIKLEGCAEPTFSFAVDTGMGLPFQEPEDLTFTGGARLCFIDHNVSIGNHEIDGNGLTFFADLLAPFLTFQFDRPFTHRPVVAGGDSRGYLFTGNGEFCVDLADGIPTSKLSALLAFLAPRLPWAFEQIPKGCFDEFKAAVTLVANPNGDFSLSLADTLTGKANNDYYIRLPWQDEQKVDIFAQSDRPLEFTATCSAAERTCGTLSLPSLFQSSHQRRRLQAVVAPGRGGRLRVGVVTPRAGRLAITATAARGGNARGAAARVLSRARVRPVLSRARVRVRKAGLRIVSLRLTRAGRRLARGRRSVPIRVRVAFTPKRGATRRAVARSLLIPADRRRRGR